MYVTKSGPFPLGAGQVWVLLSHFLAFTCPFHSNTRIQHLHSDLLECIWSHCCSHWCIKYILPVSIRCWLQALECNWSLYVKNYSVCRATCVHVYGRMPDHVFKSDILLGKSNGCEAKRQTDKQTSTHYHCVKAGFTACLKYKKKMW